MSSLEPAVPPTAPMHWSMNLRVRAGAVALIVILSICALVRFSRKPSNTAHAPTRGLPAPLGLPTTGRPAHP